MDPARLRLYGEILNWVALVAGIAATAFPILYSFSTWNRSTVGRVMMANAVVTAMLIDLVVISRFKILGPIESLNIYLVGLILFAGTKTAMSVMMWQLNHGKDCKHERVSGRARSSGDPDVLVVGEVVQHPEVDHPDRPAGSGDVLPDDRGPLESGRT